MKKEEFKGNIIKSLFVSEVGQFVVGNGVKAFKSESISMKKRRKREREREVPRHTMAWKRSKRGTYYSSF